MSDDFFEDFDINSEMDVEEQERRQKEQEEYIIEQYKNQEEMMILVFAQWCVNNDLDPQTLYREAYPEQASNKVLTDAINNTVSKAESDQIPYDIVLEALQSFGNDDLAFIVEKAAQEMSKEEDEE